MSEILSIGELLDLGGSASTAGLIPYSALEYSAQVITGISGTAIGGQGGTDSATVSAIASAYAESAASGKLDSSASSMFQPSGNYQTAGDYAFNSSVSSKQDASAMTAYAFQSSNSAKLDKTAQVVTSIQKVGNSILGWSATGINEMPIVGPVSSLQSGTAKIFLLTATAYSGINGYPILAPSAISWSGASAKLDKSASSMFQPSGNYQTAGDYAFNSSVSSKLDASASSQFAPSGDYADKSALSSYVPVSASGQFAPSGDYAYSSSLSGKLDTSAFTSYTATASGHTYTSPSATIDIDNEHGTMEATRYAIRQMPAINWTSTLAPNATTAYIDYAASTLDARSATLTFTDISGATQLKVSGLSSLDSAAYHYIGNAPTLTIPSAVRDLLFVSGDTFGWSAKVTISAPAEPDRVEPLLYSSDRVIESVSMAKGGAPYITSLNKWAISASLAGSAHHAGDADYATNANSSTSAASANKAVSAQAALKYFTGASSSDTAYISSLAGSMYTSPSGTIAVNNVNSTLESWNSSLRVDEHVTAASSFTGTAQQLYSSDWVGNWSSVWTGGTLPGDVAVFSATYPREVPYGGYNVSAFGINTGGGTAKLAEFNISRWPLSPYSGSATASAMIDNAYTSIYMLVSGTNVPSTGQSKTSVSGIANVERPGATASSTSVYENVLKDSMWQSLTAWATAQGWTP